jgi:hypothetical protein
MKREKRETPKVRKHGQEKSRQKQFKAYERALAKLVTQEWVGNHQEIVACWWGAGIAGGMFRAGWAAANAARSR